MAKLIDRDPTQEMIDVGREALNLAKRISADEIPLVFSYMYDAAPEIQKNPVAWMIDDDGDVEYNGVDRFSCGRTGGVPLYTFPPDAQAEIAKLNARIDSLTAAGAEYQRQCFEQAAEISRLKAVIAKCKDALEQAKTVRARLAAWRTTNFGHDCGDQHEKMKREFPLMDETLAAIKEIEK